MPELKRMPVTRIVAMPAALDCVKWSKESLVLRTAPDEVLVTPPLKDISIDDPYAIVVTEGGFAGAWLQKAEALDILERCCEWEIPQARPAFAQGAIADIPAKLWFGDDRVLVMVPAPYVVDFEERIA